jgi:hypothetical protein
MPARFEKEKGIATKVMSSFTFPETVYSFAFPASPSHENPEKNNKKVCDS